MMGISHYSNEAEAKRIGATDGRLKSSSFAVIAPVSQNLPHSSGGGVESCVMDYVKNQKGDEARKTSPPICEGAEEKDDKILVEASPQLPMMRTVAHKKAAESANSAPSTSQLMELEVYAQLHPELEISLDRNGLHIGRLGLSSPVNAPRSNGRGCFIGITSASAIIFFWESESARAKGDEAATPCVLNNKSVSVKPAKPFPNEFASEESEKVRAWSDAQQLGSQKGSVVSLGQTDSPSGRAPLREATT